MLKLSRKQNESIVTNGSIKVVVTSIQGGKVRLGIEAPQDVPIQRHELCADQHQNLLPKDR